MHHIHYLPGTIAIISAHPPPTRPFLSHADHNILSRVISEFNRWLKDQPSWVTPTEKTLKLINTFNHFTNAPNPKAS